MKLVTGGQIEKKKIAETARREAGEHVDSLTAMGDIEAAIAIESGTADYYLGVCNTGGGGVLAMVIAILGASQCVTVGMPEKVLSNEEIIAEVKAGKKVFGFAEQDIDVVVPIILKAILGLQGGKMGHGFLMCLFAIDPMKTSLTILIGGVSAMMANRGIAVFHDGLRPLIPEYLEGRMNHKTLAATSFALSFGLVIGFGLPFSLTVPVILVHNLLLGTDVVGTWYKNNRRGFVSSGIIGAIHGAASMAGLRSVVDLFSMIPVDFMSNLSRVGGPVVVCFSLFPASAVSYQYGRKKGVWVLVATLAGYWVAQPFGSITFGGRIEKPINLDPNGITLLLAMIVMFYFTVQEKPAISESVDGIPHPGASEMLVGLFSSHIERIQDNKWLLVLSGGLCAVAASMSLNLLAKGSVSLRPMVQGEQTSALLVSLARATSFIPLVGMTVIATGVYSLEGMKFVFVAGLTTNNPLIAFIVGSITMLLEIKLLARIAIWLDKYPGIKECGDHIRTAITRMLEVPPLVGEMIASSVILSGMGFLLVAGVYLLNRASRRPLVEMAIGPVVTIAAGVLANFFYFIGII